MKVPRRTLARIGVLVGLVGAAVGLSTAPAHADALTGRVCQTHLTGDGLRRLDVCERGWTSTDFSVTRGVVEMHTFARSGSGWADSRSQSITVNLAEVNGGGHHVVLGEDVSLTSCRRDGPAGSIGCGTANTVRVAYYSAAIGTDPSTFMQYQLIVRKISWRDDRGVPHIISDLADASPLWLS
jgi:hypothetical protein